MTHFVDTRRPVGRRYEGAPRADGTGYFGSIHQYPVICAADVVEQAPSYGRQTPVATTDQRAVTCPDCRERLS